MTDQRQPWEQRSSCEGNMSSSAWLSTSTAGDIIVYICDSYPGGAHPGDHSQYPIVTLPYCVWVVWRQCHAKSHILMQANAALVESLVKALREVGHAPTVTSLPRFLGRPDSPGDPTIDEWLSAFDVFVRQCGVAEGERAVLL